ncbi:helix-turn-helix domain-containing protein, partial [Selenomonas sp.]
ARLFFTHPDRALLRRLADQRLAVLRDYDAQHHAQLTETLHQYLLAGGSLQATAEATFTHRNTANYRVHKIKELTNCELQSAEERFAFLLAYEIDAYLNLSSKSQP